MLRSLKEMGDSSDSGTGRGMMLMMMMILQLQVLWSYGSSGSCTYTSIISFGDSLADTGNLKQLASSSNRFFPFFQPPYGQTFFHQPTGRCSNGRLVIDFVAESLDLPLIGAYVGGVEIGSGGVNYAVAGATALDPWFLEERGVFNKMTNASLGVQMAWFKQSFCANASSSDCEGLIGQALILMGEIGGNDYNHAFVVGKSIQDVESYVPFVVSSIASTINDLIDVGAKTLVIPGNLPIGCSAAYLTMYFGSNKQDYDNTTGCLTRLNKFAEYHNELLQIELNRIRELHPEVHVIYADYYNAAMQFYKSPNKYGFTNGALKACCGGEGPFNCDPSVSCGYPKSTMCAQPDTYINWDGMHLTEAAYMFIYKSVFQGSYSVPRFDSLCPAPMLQKRHLWNQIMRFIKFM